MTSESHLLAPRKAALPQNRSMTCLPACLPARQAGQGRSKNLLILFILLSFFAFIFKIYYERATSFGCFDDCFNYVAAYFMLKGKVLYSEIFFNHQMLAPYLSYLLQKFFHPQTVYELVLFHRLFLLIFSFIFGVFLILRFRLAGAAFILFYEPTKYYLFGNRFLGESFIVYPLVYLLGIYWYKIWGQRLYFWDYLLAGTFTWFVVFIREPYIPLVLFLYSIILWGSSQKFFSFLTFLFLSLITILSVSLPDYFFNILKVNTETIIINEVKMNNLLEGGILRNIFYPFLLFFGGKWNLFRIYLLALDLVFLFLLGFLIFRQKRYKLALVIFLLLGLANIRTVIPGTIFYEAFHLLPWYGLFLMSLFLLLPHLPSPRSLLSYSLTFFLVLVLGFLLFSPGSYLWDKVDRHAEFVAGYGDYLANGEVIRTLTDPEDTLFLDNRQDLTYWHANLKPAYKYSWYTWVMPGITVYDEARLEMFRNFPPDFYYGDCPGKTEKAQTLPQEKFNDYLQLYFAGRPTCLYIKKEKAREIPPQRWEKLKGLQYSLLESPI